MRTTLPVREGDHAVYVFRKRFLGEAGGDQFSGECRAVAGGHNGNVVSGSNAPVRPLITEKGGGGGVPRPRLRLLNRRDCCCIQLSEREIMHMDVVAWLDWPVGETNQVAITVNRLSRCYCASGDFVTRRNGGCGQ